MAREIPGPPRGEVDFTARYQLDGAFYGIRLRWNRRAACWFMDLSDATGAPLASGVGLRLGAPLTMRLRTRPGMPQGVFGLVDTTGSGVDPGLDELGQRVRLVYLTAQELVEEGLAT